MSRCITMMTMTGEEEGDGDDDIARCMQKYTGMVGSEMESPISVAIICIKVPSLRISC